MNPYDCSACHGEGWHEPDCPFNPDNDRPPYPDLPLTRTARFFRWLSGQVYRLNKWLQRRHTP